MANINDTLRPKNRQILSTLYDLLNSYQVTIDPCNLPDAKSHLSELLTAINAGIGAIGSLIFWSLDNEEYSSDLFKHDMLNIAYLMIQLEQVAHFAENERAKFNFQLQIQKSSS